MLKVNMCVCVFLFFIGFTPSHEEESLLSINDVSSAEGIERFMFTR